MNFKLLIVVLLIMSSTFIWAGYEIELVSETTFQNDFFGSVSLTEYNGKLYFAVQGTGYGTIYCIDESGVYELPQFPADGKINGVPLIVYDGKLYCRFCYNSNINIGYLGCFDGINFSVIENLSPDHYGINSLDKAVVYDDKLYITYIEGSGDCYLASFDGVNITPIEQYDTPNFGSRVVFDNKLLYFNENRELRCFDGLTTTTISHPVGADYTMFYNTAVLDDKIYLRYHLDNGNYTLAVFDGTSMELLINPACDGTGMQSEIYSFDHRIFYLSRNVEGSYDEELVCYNPVTGLFENISFAVDYNDINSIFELNSDFFCLIEKEDSYEFLKLSGSNFLAIEEGAFISYLSSNCEFAQFDDKLFYPYQVIDWELMEATPHFGYFDGTETNDVDISALATNVNCPLSVHNDELYLLINAESGRDSNYKIGVCRQVEDDPLPVTLSGFNCSLSGDSPLLQWVTLSETANAGWNVYRGINDVFSEGFKVNFSLISGQGTTTETTNYSFLDEFPVDKGTTYYYWLESIGQSGQSDNFGPVELFIPSDEEIIPEIPDTSLLRQNIPNPFNPTTTISYDIAYPGNMELSIYNAKGQLVETLFKGYREPGFYSATWQADQIASGIYYVKLSSVGYVKSRKMLLLK